MRRTKQHASSVVDIPEAFETTSKPLRELEASGQLLAKNPPHHWGVSNDSFSLSEPQIKGENECRKSFESRPANYTILPGALLRRQPGAKREKSTNACRRPRAALEVAGG